MLVSSVKPGKQIVLSSSTTVSTVLYTVPAGKSCTGVIAGSPGTDCGFYINNQIVRCAASGSTYGYAPVTVTLLAGTIVSATNSQGVFIGVES